MSKSEDNKPLTRSKSRNLAINKKSHKIVRSTDELKIRVKAKATDLKKCKKGFGDLTELMTEAKSDKISKVTMNVDPPAEESAERTRQMNMMKEIENEWNRLRTAQNQIETKMAALEQRKLEIEKQSEDIRKEREALEKERMTRNTAAEDNGMINGLVRQLHVVNLDAKVPRFTEDVNPLQFLEQLEGYFNLKNIRVENRLLALDGILEGRVNIWFQVSKAGINDFEHFKTEFRSEFYSIPVRVRFKNRWLSRRYSNKDGSMQNYLYSQLKEAKYFEPNLPQYEIIYSIVQQFSDKIRSTLAAIDYTNLSLVTQAISQLEEIYSETETTRSREYGRSAGSNNPQRFNNQYSRVNTLGVEDDRNNPYFKTQPSSHKNIRKQQAGQGQQQHFNNPRFDAGLPDVRFPPPERYGNNNRMYPHNFSNDERNLNCQETR